MDLAAQLNRTELPVRILKLVAKSQPEYKAIVRTAMAANRQVILVTGGDSPHKEVVIAFLMREIMCAANKTGRWVPPTKAPTGWQDDTWPVTGVIAVPSVDALNKQQQQSLAMVTRTNIPNGKYLVLGCFNWKNLAEYFGSEIYAYIRHALATHDVKSDAPSELCL